MIKPNVKLSKFVSPVRYELMLRPDFSGFTFLGEETIAMQIDKPVKEITLHSVGLEIEEAEITSGKFSEAGEVSYQEKEETVTLGFQKKLPVGKAQLRLKFKGILADNLKGFYRSKFEIDGVEKFLATTQFESTDARRAFPCFDEPSQKCIFDISLIVPSEMEAISNTLPEIVSQHEGGFKVVKFAPTPKMSTYLLAFIIGDLEYIEANSKNGVLVRIFTTPGKLKQAEFALEVAIKCLDFYENYFGIKYPVTVLDLIAIPDFSAGAMENWGAVTYRETALLIDPEKSSSANRQQVAVVIAHELAHQWFGNLVTMEWWTHLWLNEGFASYIEYLAVDHIFPEWQMWTQFLTEDHGRALELDGLANTHPVEIEVVHPDEISEIFDAVSYSKGSSIIRMLAEFLGQKVFRDGLRHYLKRHQYANAKTEDLWNALEEVSGQNVAKIMHNWTSKPGYPLISVKAKGKREKFELTQKRYFSSPISSKKSNDKTIWSIPLKVMSNGLGVDGSEFLMDKKTLTIPGGESWVKLNFGETSFIRVDYSKELLLKLGQALEEGALGPLDRFGLIRDGFDLSEAGFNSTDEALKLALNYKAEDNYTVWLELAGKLNKVANLISEEPYFEDFEKYARTIFADIAGKVGWEKVEGEGHTDSLLRALALYSFGSYGDQETIKKAQLLFDKYIQTVIPSKEGIQLKPPPDDSNLDSRLHGNDAISSDLRGVVYNLVAENGGEKEYSQLLALYKKETLQQERDRIARALSLFKSKTLLKKTLDFALSKDVRSQDAIFVLGSVWRNPKGKDITWEFVQKNWKVLKERYSGGHFLIPRLIQSAAVFTTKENAVELEKFFKQNPAPEAQRAIKQVLEQIYSNANWLKRDSKQILSFLGRYGSN